MLLAGAHFGNILNIISSAFQAFVSTARCNGLYGARFLYAYLSVYMSIYLIRHKNVRSQKTDADKWCSM